MVYFCAKINTLFALNANWFNIHTNGFLNDLCRKLLHWYTQISLLLRMNSQKNSMWCFSAKPATYSLMLLEQENVLICGHLYLICMIIKCYYWKKNWWRNIVYLEIASKCYSCKETASNTFEDILEASSSKMYSSNFVLFTNLNFLQ